MARFQYVGSCPGIITKLDGVEMEVRRGQTVDVSDETAELLAAQEENWVRVDRKSTLKKEGD